MVASGVSRGLCTILGNKSFYSNSNFDLKFHQTAGGTIAPFRLERKLICHLNRTTQSGCTRRMDQSRVRICRKVRQVKLAEDQARADERHSGGVGELHQCVRLNGLISISEIKNGLLKFETKLLVCQFRRLHVTARLVERFVRIAWPCE